MSAKQLRQLCTTSLWLGLAITVIYIIFNCLIGFAVVRGASMSPTFNTGSLLLIRKIGVTPKRFDIIIAKPEHYNEQIIKRVIGVEGDTVDINFQTGEVKVNGLILDEPYIAEKTTVNFDTDFPLVVKPGTVFVLGDNRNHSLDSRTSEIGLIPIDHIMGIYVYTLKK